MKNQVESVIREALGKYEKGRLDAINYLCFQIIRLRSIKDVS